MSELRDHLLAPLDKGGHGHTMGYPVGGMDEQARRDLHEDDHRPGAWWADALTHTHSEQDAAP